MAILELSKEQKAKRSCFLVLIVMCVLDTWGLNGDHISVNKFSVQI